MVLIVVMAVKEAPCRRNKEHGDYIHYKMVLVVAPCKTDMVLISTTKLWWCQSPLQDGGGGDSLQKGHGG